MTWLKTKLDVKMSVFDCSIVVLSLAYHKFDFALKSPRTIIIYGFFQPYDRYLILSSLKTFQIHLCFG